MFRCCFCIKPVQIKTWSLNNFCFHQNPYFKVLFYQPFSSISAATNANQEQTPSKFTVLDYLMNSCGLSPEAALSASKAINLETPEQPDSVLALLRSYGFDKTHISDLITKRPSILITSVDNILKPKLQFFLGFGFSLFDLQELIVANSRILRTSLKKRLIPSIDLLREVVQTNENIIKAIKRYKQLPTNNLHKKLVPNISILQSHGIPNSTISKLFLLYPGRFLMKTDKFCEIVSRVKELGFDSKAPSMFVVAAMAICSLSKSRWDAKIGVYRSLGWSETEIQSAFKKQPYCMRLSEKKVRRTVDFFSKELNWEPSRLASCPYVLLYSLEARIIPRYRVIQILTSKNLIQNKAGISSICNMSEKRFLEKYVTRYQEQVLDILKVYQDRMGSTES